VLRCSGLALATGSILDLGDNDLIIPGGNAAEVNQWIRDWRLIGKAAEYRTTVGILNDKGDANHTPITTTFAGQNVLATDVLVKYTWNGDVNLDGRLNADDYFFIDQGFLQKPTPPKYRDGDFNLDGKINADDYFLIDSAFLNQKGQVLSAPKPALTASFAASAGAIDIRRSEQVLTAPAAAPSVPKARTSSIFSVQRVREVWDSNL
jgi:hypothetical protein